MREHVALALYSVNVQDAVLHPLLFGGDQLTAARARGISPMTRLEGLIPCAEDWHAKVNLLEVLYHNYTVYCRLFGNIFIWPILLLSMELYTSYEIY